MWRVWMLCLAGGCPAPTKSEPGDSGGSSPEDSNSAATHPKILSADAWCYFHKTGQQYYNWDAACVVDDPQGPGGLTGGTLAVFRDGAQVVSHLLACNRESGTCTTTFREDLDGILCADATSYTFRFTVTDEDGNTSDPVEVVGRAE